MMELVKNKNVIVTGATRGIGRGIAVEFAKHGSNVAFTYTKSFDQANNLVKDLELYDVKAKAYQSDASIFLNAEKLIDSVLKDFSGIDVLVNNAGITRDNLLMRLTEQDFDDVINVNLKSVFNMTKASLRTFLKQRSGSIINMSSIVGVQGNAGQSNYSASKAGIIGFSKSIAKEIGSRNIRCNVIAPGFIETEMTAALGEDVINKWSENIPLKKPGSTEDIANACLYLSSDMSSYVTGQVLSVCGGMLS